MVLELSPNGTASVSESSQGLMSPLVLSDKNSRNDGLYQGTPSGVPQRSAPDESPRPLGPEGWGWQRLKPTAADASGGTTEVVP